MFWPGNWSFSGWSGPSTLQKRLVKFLLRRTVGQFMKHDSIDLDDLDVQLSEGCLRLRNVALNEDALTDMLSGAPVSITSGLIGEITFKVPWSQLWTGHCDISVDRVSVVAELLDPTNAPYAAHDIAESVQTDGATSILASSVFIADDFLRDESGSHPSDRGNATTLNRDVEQMVSNIYEERLRWKMANDASRRRQSVVGGGPPIPNRQDESGSPDVFTEPSPEEKDMTRLQLVSEMVDRILSGLNINVGKIDLQLRLPFDHKDNNPSSRSAYLNLEVGSIRYFDNPSGQSHLPAVDEFVPNDSDFSMEPRYRAIEFRTLHKRLLIDGVLLRYYPSSNGVDLGPSATPSDYCFTLFSTFDDVVTADIRIHRRQPFTEIAIVQRVFDVQGESGSIYMGSMPGEFRDSSSARPNNEWSPTDADSPSRVTPRATAADGRAEDKAPTSNGWDAQLRVKDVAFVLSSEHIDIVRRLGDLFQGFLSERAEKVELRSRYGASMPMHQQGPLGLSFETSANRRVFDLVLESFVFIVLAPPADSASDDELAATTHRYHHHHQDVWHGVHDSGTLKQQLASQKHLDLTLSDLAFNYEAFEPGRAAADFILSSGSRHYSLALDPDTPSLAPGRDGYQQQQRHRQDPDGPSLELSLSIGDIQFIDHDPCRNMPRAPVLVLGPALDKAALSCINVERSCHLYFRKRANDPTFEAHMAPLRIDLDLELADRMRVYDGLFSEPRDTQQSANVVKDDGPPVEAASKVPPRTFAHTFGSGAGQHHFQEGTHRSDAEPLYK
ncbi:autophagy- protein 2, partial [Spiromyces aspiralis]